MRLTLTGKVVLFVLGLAGLYALWRQLPRREAAWRVPAVRVPGPMSEPVQRPAGLSIGYVGVPPLGALDLDTGGGRPNPAIRKETGQDAALEERATVAELLKDVGSGRLHAAVVDFPSVVFAARRGSLPYHVVLLVGWRSGSDVIAVRGGGPWRPAEGMIVEPGTSGEYLARRALASGQYSPQDAAAGREALKSPRDGAGAAAGRLETLPDAARYWPVWRSAGDFGLKMPDVLVVNTKWERQQPKTVEGLARAWLAAQEEMRSDPSALKRFATAQADALGIRAGKLEESLSPAPLIDQMAFAGLSEKGTTYMELVTAQMRTVEPGPRPPDAEFNVPMDPAPLTQAAPLLVKSQ